MVHETEVEKINKEYNDEMIKAERVYQHAASRLKANYTNKRNKLSAIRAKKLKVLGIK